MPEIIDTEIPKDARTRTGYDGKEDEQDEFNKPERTLWFGNDPYWEAVHLWYGATADLEWYGPQQVTTCYGSLVITMDSAPTSQPGLTPGTYHLISFDDRTPSV